MSVDTILGIVALLVTVGASAIATCIRLNVKIDSKMAYIEARITSLEKSETKVQSMLEKYDAKLDHISEMMKDIQLHLAKHGI
jgi:peptidoglycan hydrolase CwlO-like protein